MLSNRFSISDFDNLEDATSFCEEFSCSIGTYFFLTREDNIYNVYVDHNNISDKLDKLLYVYFAGIIV